PTSQNVSMTEAFWHAESVDEAVRRLNSSRNGLSESEALARFAAFGPNRLARTRTASALRILVDQLASILVWLLRAAAVVTLASGDYLETVAIIVVLVLNTAIGFGTELRARRAMEALYHLEVPRATVVRDGRTRVIDSSQLVSGDIVELTAGQAVPADGR